MARPTSAFEFATLKVLAILCAVASLVQLLILSPDAWRLSVACGVLAGTFAVIALRRSPGRSDRLVLLAVVAAGIAGTAAGVLSGIWVERNQRNAEWRQF